MKWNWLISFLYSHHHLNFHRPHCKCVCFIFNPESGGLNGVPKSKGVGLINGGGWNLEKSKWIERNWSWVGKGMSYEKNFGAAWAFWGGVGHLWDGEVIFLYFYPLKRLIVACFSFALRDEMKSPILTPNLAQNHLSLLCLLNCPRSRCRVLSSRWRVLATRKTQNLQPFVFVNNTSNDIFLVKPSIDLFRRNYSYNCRLSYVQYRGVNCNSCRERHVGKKN